MTDQPAHTVRSPRQQSRSKDFNINPIIIEQIFSTQTVHQSQGRKYLDQEMLDQRAMFQEGLLRFNKKMEGRARASKPVQGEHNIDNQSSWKSGFGAAQEEAEAMELQAAGCRVVG